MSRPSIEIDSSKDMTLIEPRGCDATSLNGGSINSASARAPAGTAVPRAALDVDSPLARIYRLIVHPSGAPVFVTARVPGTWRAEFSMNRSGCAVRLEPAGIER